LACWWSAALAGLGASCNGASTFAPWKQTGCSVAALPTRWGWRCPLRHMKPWLSGVWHLFGFGFAECSGGSLRGTLSVHAQRETPRSYVWFFSVLLSCFRVVPLPRLGGCGGSGVWGPWCSGRLKPDGLQTTTAPERWNAATTGSVRSWSPAGQLRPACFGVPESPAVWKISPFFLFSCCFGACAWPDDYLLFSYAELVFCSEALARP